MDECVRNRIDAWLDRRVKDQSVNEFDSLAACVGTTLGNVREENQDRAVIVRFTSEKPLRSFLLFSVCDGLGGMQDGARCARLALAEVISELIHSDEPDSKVRLLRAVSSANILVTSEYSGRGGTTLSAVLVASSGQAWATNVGDSRIYQYTPKLGCKQISVDDTIAGQIQRLRGLTSSEIDRTHFSDHLAQYIGIGEELEPHSHKVDVCMHESHYLLTSDGAHGPVSAALAGLATHAPSSSELVRRILHFSKWTGGYDNASAVAFGPISKTALSVDRPLHRDLLELWDPYSKLELIVPAQTHIDRNPKTESNRPGEASSKQSTTKKYRVPRKRKGVVQKEPAQATEEPRKETKDLPELDIAVFSEVGVAEKKSN